MRCCFIRGKRNIWQTYDCSTAELWLNFLSKSKTRLYWTPWDGRNKSLFEVVVKHTAIKLVCRKHRSPFRLQPSVTRRRNMITQGNWKINSGSSGDTEKCHCLTVTYGFDVQSIFFLCHSFHYSWHSTSQIIDIFDLSCCCCMFVLSVRSLGWQLTTSPKLFMSPDHSSVQWIRTLW